MGQYEKAEDLIAQAQQKYKSTEGGRVELDEWTALWNNLAIVECSHPKRKDYPKAEEYF